MFDAIADLLNFFYGVWPSFGGAIILLTLAIMTVLTPLQIKGQRSMMKMQELAPEMKRIQAKHKDDRDAMNRELMAFYQENKINPLGGCFPLLLQMPVFIVLFQVLRGLSRLDENGAPNPRYLSEATDLGQAIREAGGKLPSFGLDLARSASEVWSDSVVDALPYLLLVGITGLTGWYQQKQMQARRDPNQTVNPQQQAIMRLLPIMLPIFSIWFPAGLVVYFVVSNLYRVGQQAYINQTMGLPIFPDLRPGAGSPGKAGGKKTGGGGKGRAARSKGSRGGPKRPSGRRDQPGPAAASRPQPRPRKKKKRK